MSWNGLSVLAVVPARGGSKGIPRKNLQEVGGLSLVARAARVARSLPWIDQAIVSTDDQEIAERWVIAMRGKRAGHGIDDETFLQPDRPMSAIGG